MDNISDMKDVIEKKELIDYNSNDIKDKTENEMKYRGDIIDRPQGVSYIITEEEFVDVMNQLNDSINKNNELER